MQGDTGHSQARMVTDVYAHTFDGNRREIAHKLDTLFFTPSDSKRESNAESDVVKKLAAILEKKPELLQLLTALSDQ